jgi:hypothetical protein
MQIDTPEQAFYHTVCHSITKSQILHPATINHSGKTIPRPASRVEQLDPMVKMALGSGYPQ